ncbi:CRISPR-associated endoribonuclease Cas6 [Inediibacterium massiliense]|uniref:CRISPR-associated endoribonuclease Cas6 n=1 Tax=Inediibacterium massiliense TaxID=1658111 RepID=UPI0006B5A6B2|nr:CRISPR-associated endoribonuclease Cas6 [Inediibacterium massiliense]
MLTYWTIYFRNTEKIINTIDNARIWHGIFFDILKQYDKEIADKYHDQGKKQSFSISPILCDTQSHVKYFEKNTLLKVNISLLTNEIYSGLFEFIKKNNKIPFAKGYLMIEEVNCKTISEDMLQQEKITRGVLKFITPTTFRVNPIQYPLPDPKKIFSNLNKSYCDAYKTEIKDIQVFDELEKYIIIEGFNIKTEIAKYRKFTITGFCGNVNIRIKHPNKKIQDHLEKLFAVASYVGIGYKTGMGMGQCIALKK